MLEGGLFTVILAFSAITGHKNGDIGKRSCFKVSAPQNHETKILSSKFCGQVLWSCSPMFKISHQGQQNVFKNQLGKKCNCENKNVSFTQLEIEK